MYNGYDISMYNAKHIPNSVHGGSSLSNQYFKYLFQKVFAIFEWKNIPKTWNTDFLTSALLTDGYISVAEYEEFGVIPMNCKVTKLNVYYQPKTTICTNPYFTNSIYKEVGVDSVLLHLNSNYQGVCDLVGMYADMMSLCVEGMATNLVNSKLAYVFSCKNKTSAESFKKMFDNIQKGDPSVFVDKNLYDQNGNKMWDTFSQSLNSNFIAPQISDLMQSIESRFDGEFGLGNVGLVEKKERLITNEVEADEESRNVRIQSWLDSLKKGCQEINDLFGLNIDVDFRLKKEVKSEESEAN